MAVSKVVLNTTDGEETLIDLTQDTVTADTLVYGATAHGADGEAIVGTFDVHTTLAEHMADYNNPHQVTAEQVGARPDTWVPTAAQVGAATSARYTYTLTSSGWTGSAAPYVQTAAISGILSSDAPMVDILQTGNEEADGAIREAWGLITRAVTSANALTVYASDIPSVDIPIQMLCVR